MGGNANRYCFDDSDCPVHHTCLTPDRAAQAPSAGSPMCIARPLLEDGRLRSALNGLNGLTGSVPLPKLDLGAQLTQALTGASAPVQTAGGRVLADRIEATIADATVTWIPDSRPAFRGAGVLRVDLELQDHELLVGGKLRPKRLGDQDLLIRAKLATIRLEFRPKVNHHPRRNELRLRALPPLLFDKHGNLIGSNDVRVLEPDIPVELLLPPFEQLIGVLFGFRDAVVQHFVELDPDDLASVGVIGGLGRGLGALIRPILDQALVGGLLFGVAEAASDPIGLHTPPVLEAAASAGGSLDLRYRGDRVSFSEVIPRAMEEIDTDPFCCALPEPSPNCLEFDFEGAGSTCTPSDCAATPFAQCAEWRTRAVDSDGMACFP